MTDSPQAVVEIGSVSTGLLIVAGDATTRQVVDLDLGGQRLGATGTISAHPVDDSVLGALRDALSGFASTIADAGLDPAATRVVGTAAVRRATNRAALEAAVNETLGVDLDVLDPEAEAYLVFRGAATALGATPAATTELVVIDLSGGSTSVVIGGPDGPRGVYVIPVGGALLSATYLTSDPPRPAELSAALSVVELHIDDVVRNLAAVAPLIEATRDVPPEATVVVTGAAEIVAAVEIGLADVDPRTAAGAGIGPVHGFELSREAAEDVFRTLATEAADDRSYNPGLPPGRVGDIVGACGVLVEFMRQWDLEHVVVSQAGLAHGVATETESVDG